MPSTSTTNIQGYIFLVGKGAGSTETAKSIVSDIVFITTGIGKQKINIETLSHNRHAGKKAMFSIANAL